MEGVDEQVLHILSSLIAHKNRADAKGWRDAFENMPVYLKRVELDADIHRLPVIHVAGTKGKGSTCAMLESMLRRCGYRTGLFTSPHLVDVRERVRINGCMVDKAVFEEHFWWCYDRFNALATPEVGVPGYFRFITLLALKIFLQQRVDVVVLEVGIGGRLDATNIIPHPVVCGITALGMDHMDMLGDTLAKIAGEKAGILKPGRPGLTVPQPEDAMEVIRAAADRVQAPLQVVSTLDDLTPEDGPGPVAVGLGGKHQRTNGALAVQLCARFEAERLAAGEAAPGAAARLALLQHNTLPAQYAQGLRSTSWLGRSTVVHDTEFALPAPHEPLASSSTSNGSACNGSSHVHAATATSASATPHASTIAATSQGGGAKADAGPHASRLSYYIDGAHTPESMATCGQWYAQAAAQPNSPSSDKRHSTAAVHHVLVFNCLKERDPSSLLPALAKTLASHGVLLSQAIFVPPESQYSALMTKKPPQAPILPAANLTAHLGKQQQPPQQQQQGEQQPREHSEQQPQQPDYSWQAGMQQVWEKRCLAHGHSSVEAPLLRASGAPKLPSIHGWPLQDPSRGAVSPSLGATLEYLRGLARSQPELRLRVLVTGSLYLVGDVLRLLGRVPK